MTELYFKGKEFVYNHHLTVPHRPLVPHAKKGIGEPRLDGNLIVQGDNLHALKALLPLYAGKVDCIFIDPPYNTGNEGWCYNDNVNAPMIKEWLEANPISIEDGLRHDKWCAMMWPRLRLLRELLSDSGSIWVTCDDNEVHRLRQMLDEIFHEELFVGIFVIENNRKGRNDKEHVALTHEYMIIYSNDEYLSRGLELTEQQISEFNQVNAEGRRYMPRDLRKRGSEDRREDRESMFFPIYWDKNTGATSLERQSAGDVEILPKRGDGSDGRWRWGKSRVAQNLEILMPREGRDGRLDIDYMVFLDDADEADAGTRKKPKSVWFGPEYSTDHATTLIKNIFGINPLKHSPKALEHVVRAVQLAVGKDGIVLDSFAGSGTTAHAVLEANNRDDGNRRFVLVEMEDYADELTAERMRRVIQGYEFKGTQRTVLLRESVNWRGIQNASDLVHKIQGIENLHGHEYDRITKQVKDNELTVVGEKQVAERAEGLGGEFTYCTLGSPIDMDKILTGERLPAFADLGAILFHTATSRTIDPERMDEVTGYIGEAAGRHFWLIYKPDLNWLKTPQAALTLSFARSAAEKHPKAGHVVFAPANHTSPKLLDAERLKVQFAPLPYALYRVERS
ncbi:site-specific DNA-methyltransferase [Mesorhizobium sp. B2-4-4]|uniref:site-specific DNA-methyltransferase n=1 Tax=Mesorhizobium sp. B2-4-4 TaxID=2589945 RepID=UPI001128B9E3|nr:site-specific DNA-methyltransferase [Mesorhizobium sp. B2-4-4]TPL53360.1 site-specific DNA-methyltransferase [Mesorhizobium sp. B2-4-4]